MIACSFAFHNPVINLDCKWHNMVGAIGGVGFPPGLSLSIVSECVLRSFVYPVSALPSWRRWTAAWFHNTCSATGLRCMAIAKASP